MTLRSQGSCLKALFKMYVFGQDLTQSSWQMKKITVNNPLRSQPRGDVPFGVPRPAWPSCTFSFSSFSSSDMISPKKVFEAMKLFPWAFSFFKNMVILQRVSISSSLISVV